MAKKKQQEAAMGFERNKFNSISKTSNTIFGIILGLLSLLMIIPMVFAVLVRLWSRHKRLDTCPAQRASTELR